MKAIYCPTKQPHELERGEWCIFHGSVYARCPCEGDLTANLASHRVTISADDVLDVAPSILTTDGAGGNRFHGFIEKGVWLGEDRKPIAP